MDPIRNIGFPEYPKVNSNSAALTGNSEKFTPAYEEPKKEKEKISEPKEQGVLLSLSGQAAGKDQASAQQTVKKPSGAANDAKAAPGSLQSLISDILQRIISLWQSITQSVSSFWNNDGRTQTEQTIEIDSETQEPPPDMVIETEEASPMENIAEDTAPDQAPVLAKNSDLLTYYDRTGRIITVQGSDRNQILNGNKGAIG